MLWPLCCLRSFLREASSWSAHSCWRDGQIAPLWPPPARQNIESCSRNNRCPSPRPNGLEVLEHPGVYETLVLGLGALVLVSGPPGAGKSSWACRLLDAIPGPVVLVAAEEGLRAVFGGQAGPLSGQAPGPFGVIARASVDAVVELPLPARRLR